MNPSNSCKKAHSLESDEKKNIYIEKKDHFKRKEKILKKGFFFFLKEH